MSELKATTAQEIVRNEKDCDYMDELFGGVKMLPTQVYIKSDVDAAIAELKQKLEDAKATAYAESVDAGMRERRLKRALWMARAEKAKHIATFCYYALHYGRVPVRDIYQCQDKWDKVELKCIKKAEEYK